MTPGIMAYSSSNKEGGVTVDTESMIVDLITVFKAGGYSLSQLHDYITAQWPSITVEASLPKSAKN